MQLWLVDLNLLQISSKKESLIIESAKPEKKGSTNESLLRKIRSRVIDFGSFDTILIIILIAAIVNQFTLFLIFYGLYLPLQWVIYVYYTMKYRINLTNGS